MFGNGWIWLVDNKGHLDLMVTHNAGSPLLFGNDISPILGLDMWEHSYYYEYLNDIDVRLF